MLHTCGRSVRGLGARALPLLVLGLFAACNSPFKRGDVVVSFAFDDAFADTFDTHSMLAARGQYGTWFIATDTLDTHGYLSRDQLVALQGEGHEIGSRIPSTMRLNTLLDFQVEYQVCKSRLDLQGLGLLVESFSYGFETPTPTIQDYVAGCGFTAARLSTGLADKACRDCAWAESVPPKDPFAIRTLNTINASSPVVDLQSRVGSTRYQKGGGWLVFVIHHVCAGSNCPYDSADPQVLDTLTAWLAEKGIAVRTIHDVMSAQ